MNKRYLRLPTLSLLAAAAITAAFSGPILAESACKGLEQRQCEGKGDCTWVNGYTRKDGVKVASYCKSIGKRSDSTGSKDDEKKASTREKKSSN